MTAYVDSSVLLRIVFGQPGALRQWTKLTRTVSSALVRLECLRAIDRVRLRFGVPDQDVAALRESVLVHLGGFDLVPIDPPVLERAAEPFATALGSLDAMHLATALLLRHEVADLRVATHDVELATAARACGFVVLGV
jgi:predicted nucleic acid-binding protein